jgi:hypothetical protein
MAEVAEVLAVGVESVKALPILVVPVVLAFLIQSLVLLHITVVEVGVGVS